MWAGKAFFSAFPWSTVSVLILSLSLRESKFTLSWLLRNTQQDINAWWVRKLWNEGRDRSLQKKVPCLYLLVCNSRLQCPWGCIDKAECRTCTVLRVSWVQPAATGKPRNSSHICYSGCGITQLAPCAVIMGIVVRLPRAKVSTPCVWGGTCMGGTRALHMSFAIHTAFVRNFNTSVCQLLLWDSFVLPQWCEGRLSFTQKPLWAAGPSFYNGSTCRQKKKGVLLLCFCVTEALFLKGLLLPIRTKPYTQMAISATISRGDISSVRSWLGMHGLLKARHHHKKCKSFLHLPSWLPAWEDMLTGKRFGREIQSVRLFLLFGNGSI